jgi:hypothetical protein
MRPARGILDKFCTIVQRIGDESSLFLEDWGIVDAQNALLVFLSCDGCRGVLNVGEVVSTFSLIIYFSFTGGYSNRCIMLRRVRKVGYTAKAVFFLKGEAGLDFLFW